MSYWVTKICYGGSENVANNRNIKKIALPAIALVGLGLIQGANAGPIAYAACVTLCCGTFPPLIPVLLPSCMAGCAPVALLPTP